MFSALDFTEEHLSQTQEHQMEETMRRLSGRCESGCIILFGFVLISQRSHKVTTPIAFSVSLPPKESRRCCGNNNNR
jgi:hypothetical protein